MSWEGPLVVVGPSRSGTSLMRAVLNEHPSIALAGETHYFDDLRVKLKDRLSSPLDEGARRQCEDYFLALAHRPYGHGGRANGSWMPREQLAQAAALLGGGPDAYWEAFCHLLADRDGASIWGEKTPRHVFRIGDILGAFPSARIVCMVRDPRSVVLSYRDWQNDQGGFDFEHDPEHAAMVALDNERARQSYNVLLLSLLWRSQVGAIRAAQQQFSPSSVYVQRYENLVQAPGESVSALCDWLGIEFDERMLEIPVLNSSFDRFDSAGGFSPASLDRWREGLSTSETAVVQTSCRSLMRDFKYEETSASATAAVAIEWVKLPWSSVRAMRANGRRVGKIGPYVTRRVRNLARRG